MAPLTLLVLTALLGCRELPVGEPCTPAEAVCAQADETLLTCNEQGDGWFATTCAPGLVCSVDACTVPQVDLLTTALPDGKVGELYAATLEIGAGSPPYRFSLASGQLPPGLALTGGGELFGVPELTGTSTFSVHVVDDQGTQDDADLAITITNEGVHIVTDPALQDGEDGVPYSVSLEALGGAPPYGWMLVGGDLPADLELFADGRIAGPMNDVGSFPFTVRVVDSSDPPTVDVRDLTLEVGFAPLAIVGDRSYNLYVTTVVLLDTLVPFVPYTSSLKATGGLRPLTWTELPIPPNLQQALDRVSTNPNAIWGLPADLTVAPDGTIHGWTMNVSDAPTINIPFTSINLTGYFFMAQVQDSQTPPATKTGLFLLPTVAIGGP